ncbi:hypothetical protein HRG_012672 [Hirsutella rhossiliensis]
MGACIGRRRCPFQEVTPQWQYLAQFGYTLDLDDKCLGQYLEEVLWETVSTRSPISAGTVDSIATKCQLNDSLAEIGAVEYRRSSRNSTPENRKPNLSSQNPLPSKEAPIQPLTAMPLTRHTRPERDDNKTFRVFQANEARSRRRTTAPSHSTTLSNTDAVLLQERWTEAKNSHCVVPAAKKATGTVVYADSDNTLPHQNPTRPTTPSPRNSTERSHDICPAEVSDCSWQLLMPLHAQNALYAQKL